MKRIFVFAFASLAIFASCSKAEIDAVDNGGQTEINVTLTDGQILCAIPSQPQSKTALDGSLNVIWSDNDEIMVLGEDNQVAKYVFSSFASDDKKAAVFDNEDPKVTGPRSAIYPASAYVADSYNGTTAKINLGGVESLPMPIGKVESVLTSSTGISALPLVSTPSEETLSFNNLFGGIMFCPYDYMGMGVKIKKLSVASTDGKAIGGVATIDVETGTVTSFEGTETELTYVTSASKDITTKYGFVAYLPAGDYPGLVITAIDHWGRKFPVTTQPITINAGLVKKLQELPLTVWYGTTNCYVVAPGATSVEVDVTPYYSWRSDYDVAKGNLIRVENGNMSGLGGGTSVVWQQEEGSQLTDLTATNTNNGSIVNGEITITRDQTEGKAIATIPLTGAKGNAVIALKSTQDNKPIVWSFHIWVSEVNDVPCQTESMGTYSILDRNIGATSIDGSLNSFGVNYQWGRKDPFPRRLTNQSGTSVYGDVLKTSERSPSIKVNYAIQNPDTRVIYTQNTTGAKWLPVSLNGLWGYPTLHGDSGNAAKVKTTIKTVYDPCPKGYKVPALGYLTSIGKLNTKEDSVVSKGYTMDTGSGTATTFFPYSGYVRVCKKGDEKSNSYQSYRGYLWTVNNRSDTEGAYVFKYNQDGIQIHSNADGARIYTYCGDALPVRCVKE